MLNWTDHLMFGIPDYHLGGEYSKHALVHPQRGMEEIAMSHLYLWIVGIKGIHLGIGMVPIDNTKKLVKFVYYQ